MKLKSFSIKCKFIKLNGFNLCFLSLQKFNWMIFWVLYCMDNIDFMILLASERIKSWNQTRYTYSCVYIKCDKMYVLLCFVLLHSTFYVLCMHIVENTKLSGIVASPLRWTEKRGARHEYLLLLLFCLLFLFVQRFDFCVPYVFNSVTLNNPR